MKAMMDTTTRRQCLAGYDEGMLKTFLDGELSASWSDTVVAHVGDCAACTERLGSLRRDGALVHGRLDLLSVTHMGASVGEPPAMPQGMTAAVRPPVGVVLARARSAARRSAAGVAGDGQGGRGDWRERVASATERLRVRGALAWRPGPFAAGTAAAAVLLFGAATTQPAVQSFAQGMLQSFRVQKVEPVRLDASMLRALPVGNFEDLLMAGTYVGPTEPKIRSASLAEAGSATGLSLRAPTRLPAALQGAPSVWVSEAVNFTYTYDGQKLTQMAHGVGVQDAALLEQLKAAHGLTAKGSIPAASVLLYGDPLAMAGPMAAPGAGTRPAGPAAAAGGARPEASTKGPVGAAGLGERGVTPYLAVLQLKSPTLDVPREVNVDQLRAQLLRSGAVPPALANQLLGMTDWKTTLPLPLTRGTAREVPVDGTTGSLVTGEFPGPALVWQKDGVLYAMTGLVSEQELLAASTSLGLAK